MQYRNAALAAAVFVPALALTGCSQDRQTFSSTVFRPLTISVRDQVSKQIVWDYDIPVHHRLVVDFARPGDAPPFKLGRGPADRMTWKLIDDTSGKAVEKGVAALTGLPVILEASVRPGPELPPSHVDRPPAGWEGVPVMGAPDPLAPVVEPGPVEPAPAGPPAVQPAPVLDAPASVGGAAAGSAVQVGPLEMAPGSGGLGSEPDLDSAVEP